MSDWCFFSFLLSPFVCSRSAFFSFHFLPFQTEITSSPPVGTRPSHQPVFVREEPQTRWTDIVFLWSLILFGAGCRLTWIWPFSLQTGFKSLHHEKILKALLIEDFEARGSHRRNVALSNNWIKQAFCFSCEWLTEQFHVFMLQRTHTCPESVYSRARVSAGTTTHTKNKKIVFR